MTETLTQNWTTHYDAALLATRDEPEWMTRLRKQAWEVYLDMPEPPPPQRNLRRIPKLDISGLSPAQAASQASEALQARTHSWGELAGACLEQGGESLSSELSEELAKQGVLLLPLSEALHQHPELVQAHFGKIYPAIAGKEIALNLAYWHGGYFLYVPRNLNITLPLYTLQSLAGQDEVLFNRSLVVVEAGARVTLIHDSWSEQAAPARISDVLELQLGDQAEVNLLTLQQWDQQVHCHSYAQANLGRDARYSVLNVATGAAYHYLQSGSTLNKTGAEARMLGLFVASGEQHFRQQSLQNHLSPHTQSHLQYHGMLRDKAYSFYNGMIHVSQQAQQTVSNQVSKNLLLSDKARADAIPNLEILADDVQSGHGAAIGSLDIDQLFYLLSRGFDRKQAEALITEGFMEEVLLQFPDTRLHVAIQQHLQIEMLRPDAETELELEEA